MADFGISERAKQIAAAAIEGKYGALEDEMSFEGGSVPATASKTKVNFLEMITKNKKFVIIGGVSLVLIAAAVAGGVYWKKNKKQ